MTVEETPISYPAGSDDLHSERGHVAVWLMGRPTHFKRHVLERRGRLSANFGKLDMFAQYALPSEFRRRYGIESWRWHNIANTSHKADEHQYESCRARQPSLRSPPRILVSATARRLPRAQPQLRRSEGGPGPYEPVVQYAAAAGAYVPPAEYAACHSEQIRVA